MNRRRVWIGLALSLAVALTAWAIVSKGGSRPADPVLLARLQEASVVLDTVEPGAPFDDLSPLKPILADKRVVALGEATHGTREFFRMKHRMLEFLVREMGFTLFGMECSTTVTDSVNQYLQGGAGDPNEIANQLTYWPWATEEVGDRLAWMRAYNAEPGVTRPIKFFGIDPVNGDRDRAMAANVVKILEAEGSDSKMMVWAHNVHVAMSAEDRMGYHLKLALGDAVYLVGFEFSDGDFTSRDFTTLRVYHRDAAPAEYYASDLAQLEAATLFLDIDSLARDPDLATWLDAPRTTHSIDEMYYLFQFYEPWQSERTPWPDLFDGVIFVRSTTYSHPLPGGMWPFQDPGAAH